MSESRYDRNEAIFGVSLAYSVVYCGLCWYSDWTVDGKEVMHKYMKFNCPECCAPLEVYYEGPIEEYPGKPWDFVWGDCRDLIRHCNNCGCDWENQWIAIDEDICESELRRKFWG